MVTNASTETLRDVLFTVNKAYGMNLCFKTFKRISSNRIRFTLKVWSSQGKGARRGLTGRRIASACWHAHGDFFDTLFNFDPGAFVISRGRKVTKEAGNWEDCNIGSITAPFYYSEACEC